MKILVAGLGNPILTDDGIGVHAIREFERLGLRSRGGNGVQVETAELGTAGLALLDLLDGVDRLVIIDAARTGAEPGTVRVCRDAGLAGLVHSGSPHEPDLESTLAIGRRLPGLRMPGDIRIVAVEAADITTFSEKPTEKVAASIPGVLETVRELLRPGISPPSQG